MAIERSSWITSIKVGVKARHVLTFFVHFLKDWRGEYDPVDFANKSLIDPDDCIVLGVDCSEVTPHRHKEDAPTKEREEHHETRNETGGDFQG
jgi:hypothetical protein